MLIESLAHGLAALNFSADQAMLDEQEEDGSAAKKKTTAGQSALLIASSASEPAPASSSNSIALWGTLAVSMVAG